MSMYVRQKILPDIQVQTTFFLDRSPPFHLDFEDLVLFFFDSKLDTFRRESKFFVLCFDGPCPVLSVVTGGSVRICQQGRETTSIGDPHDFDFALGLFPSNSLASPRRRTW